MPEFEPIYTVVEYDGTVRELNEEELANIEASQAPPPAPPEPEVPGPPAPAEDRTWLNT